MAVGFAGSRTLDERRRRRLAGGPDERQERAGSNASTGTPTDEGQARIGEERGHAATTLGGEGALASTAPAEHLPLRRIVSPRLWKHGLAGLTGILAGAGILAGGTAFTGGRGLLEAELGRLFALPDGPLVRCYVGLLLLLAGQFALLIRWGRSRSDNDFAGRYRVWGRVAAVWLLLAFGTAVDAPRILKAALSQTNLFDMAGMSPVWWSALPLAGGLILYRALHREMRDCRTSLAMLQATGGLVLFAAFSATSEAAVAGPVARAGVLMGAVLSLFLSMLLHARHVIYTSADAPAIPPLRARLRLWRLRCRPLRRFLCRIGRTVLRLMKLVRFSRKTARSAETANAKAADCQTTSAEVQERRDDRTDSQPESAPQTRDRHTERTQPPDEDSSESKPSGNQLRADQPIDKNQLKGLSKRERRKLRKKWREQRRAAGEGT